MSIKSIEHRLCCGFYDMAWLNLCACLENLPEADDGEAEWSSRRAAAREAFFAEAKPLLAAISKSTAANLSEEDAAAVADAISDGTNRLLALRDSLEQQVEDLTRYRNEAGILCRVLQRRAAGAKTVVPFDTDEEIRSLLAKIFAGNDPMMTNLRIRSMVAAFPARMTRTRFFDLISGYLSLYNGRDDGEGLASFMYRLRSAIATGPDDSSYTFVSNCLRTARDAVNGEASEEDGTIASAMTELTREADAAIGYLESVVRCMNPLAAIGILSGLPAELYADSTVADDLIPAVRLQLGSACGDDISGEDFEAAVARAHSAMEQYFEPLSVLTEKETARLQAAIDDMDDETAKAYIPVMKAARLLSTSAFASLNEEPAPDATPERIAECRDAFLREAEEHFAGQTKAYVREMMANVLSELPVWFENRTEVMEYMQQSLRGCRTEGERRYAAALLRNQL